MPAEKKREFDQVTAGLDATVTIAVSGRGAYRVPRLYIACHGLRAADLPAIAAQLGFDPA